MRYIFENFEFDSTSLVLTKNGETLAIRHNEAKLLTLLLEQTGNVLSKEDILSHVWQTKVVSEQAVFQNISNLRSLFGVGAIKTFSKRGYRWELDVETVYEDTSPAEKVPHSILQSNDKVIVNKNYCWLALFLASLVIFVLNFKADTKQTSVDSVIKLAYLPFIDLQGEVKIHLEDNVHFDFTELAHIDATNFTNSIELEYLSLAHKHPLVLTGELRTHQQIIYLDFSLKGPSAKWHGQLSGASVEVISEQLQQHLKQLFIYDLLSKPQSLEIKQAKLSIAHKQAPKDLINLGQLISVYIEMEDLERAMVMADKLVNIAFEQKGGQQIGNALLFQSEILIRKSLYDLSSHKLTLAIEQFVKIDDLKRQADALFVQSWLDHKRDDYAAMKASLLKSAKLSFDVKDIVRELDALTYLSVMAHKHQQESDKYLYLQQAENKMKVYQLPIYHFAIVPFHYAIFAKKPSDKEPHYKQVLEFTALTPDHWPAQKSRNSLMKHYIKQERLEEAQELVDSLTTDNPQNSFLKTVLALAKKQSGVFNSYAKRTFEQARLAGNRELSLDVALLLCSEPNSLINYDFYAQYIHENSTKEWRKTNGDKLLTLNI
jgi:DNA-binding winged helix-turn-helix (wHTH) protein